MLASRMHGTLYLGVTRDLARRLHEHKLGVYKGFTERYGVHRLVWYEGHERIDEAISREKRLKRWRRDWKIRLVEDMNPLWSDLTPPLSDW
ncbi:GIY-YIG nuclease family protein [Salinarimonas rosea]|uniref:GIY-YIG nuclease family protein n=1 Tax=Salinarimonas rosea TaxID=552063 RepID=UPI0005BCFFBC|nr:GIY-YIG nuclease family protein [Salinarimonas rosea]